MSLINSKVELKLRWKKHCVLSVASNDNANGNNDNNDDFYYQRHKIICSFYNCISKR